MSKKMDWILGIALAVTVMIILDLRYAKEVDVEEYNQINDWTACGVSMEVRSIIKESLRDGKISNIEFADIKRAMANRKRGVLDMKAVKQELRDVSEKK